MNPNSDHVGLIIVIVTLLIVALFILIRKIEKYKADKIENYHNVITSCMKSLDLFTAESEKLNKMTDCLLKEMIEFKKSKIYKDYMNGK